MALESVSLSSDVYLVCLAHALSTEREEIMGLLIGEVEEERVLQISAVTILRRSDKQADRVEISPEQQTAASIKAEELSNELRKPLRVIGWYHSHPHITVWPSHVDVRTQANYQLMDEGFIGLIFSVFNEDKITKTNRIQVTCFQSREVNSQCQRVEIPLKISPSTQITATCLCPLVELPQILLEEEDEAYEKVSADVAAAHNLIASIHNSSVFTKSLCNILEIVSVPLLNNLEQRLANNKLRSRQLQEEKEELMSRINLLEERLQLGTIQE